MTKMNRPRAATKFSTRGKPWASVAESTLSTAVSHMNPNRQENTRVAMMSGTRDVRAVR